MFIFVAYPGTDSGGGGGGGGWSLRVTGPHTHTHTAQLYALGKCNFIQAWRIEKHDSGNSFLGSGEVEKLRLLYTIDYQGQSKVSFRLTPHQPDCY